MNNDIKKAAREAAAQLNRAGFLRYIYGEQSAASIIESVLKGHQDKNVVSGASDHSTSQIPKDIQLVVAEIRERRTAKMCGDVVSRAIPGCICVRPNAHGETGQGYAHSASGSSADVWIDPDIKALLTALELSEKWRTEAMVEREALRARLADSDLYRAGVEAALRKAEGQRKTPDDYKHPEHNKGWNEAVIWICSRIRALTPDPSTQDAESGASPVLSMDTGECSFPYEQNKNLDR
jgi:hypothetical protein